MTYLSGLGCPAEAPPPFMLQAWLVWGREELLRNLREVARLEREGAKASHSLEEAWDERARVLGEARASTARRRRGKELRGPMWRPRRRARSGMGWSVIVRPPRTKAQNLRPSCQPLWTNTRCLSERTASAEASL